MKFNHNKVSIMVVPTGIGASIGGYAGDASVVARKIAEKIPLIVNPNIVNAACFSGITNNMYYVEGSTINELVRGNIALKPSIENKIGVIFDKKIPENILNVHINTINAVKTVYGVNVIGYEITEEFADVEFYIDETGASVGSLKTPETLLKAGQKLLSRGADVIAVVCFFDEPPEDDYENGEGVDIVGGVEAIISHYLSKELNCPCVHAPAFTDISITTNIVDSKVSAEYITPTFLPCLLLGLNNAPLTISMNNLMENGDYITYNDIHSVVVPYNALGSSLVFDSIKRGIPVYAIKENKTVLQIDRYSINQQGCIIELDSYDDYIRLIDKDIK